jgi:XTP/dITP diphosphohydrolase
MERRLLVIATRNAGKLREFRRIFHRLPLRLAGLDDLGVEIEIEETGATFEENAILKARGYMRATGRLTLADDSGLEVEALDGEPGVHSARFAGPDSTDEERTQQLLRRMSGVPAEQRTARYRVVLALADPASPDEPPITVHGVSEGRISDAPAGSSGFGYDPVFYVDRYGRTMAQLTDNEKDAISHRGAAARAMAELLSRMVEARPEGT